MTSEFTLGPTAKFFKEHDFFHLDPNDVVMFEQRMLPAVTFDGRAILEQKDKVAMAPGTPPIPEAGRVRQAYNVELAGGQEAWDRGRMVLSQWPSLSGP